MTEAAYREEQNGSISLYKQNKKNFYDRFKSIKLRVRLESTYLAWVDFSQLNISEAELKKLLKSWSCPQFYRFWQNVKEIYRFNERAERNF